MKLGSPKAELTAADFESSSIWYCDYSDDPEVDFVFVPLLDLQEVNEDVCRRGSPCIPLQIENTNWQCLGYYDIQKQTIFSVAIWMIEEWRGFNYIDGPRTPLILVSRVPILGVANRRFRLQKPDDRYTEALEARDAV